LLLPLLRWRVEKYLPRITVLVIKLFHLIRHPVFGPQVDTQRVFFRVSQRAVITALLVLSALAPEALQSIFSGILLSSSATVNLISEFFTAGWRL